MDLKSESAAIYVLVSKAFILAFLSLRCWGSQLFTIFPFPFIRSGFICFNIIKTAQNIHLPICSNILLHLHRTQDSSSTYIPDCGQSLPGDGGGHGGAQLQAAGQRHLQVQDQELRGRDGGSRGG